MDGDSVMMRLKREQYFGLGSTGSRIWKLLENPLSIRQIINILCIKYDVNEATCLTDAVKFTEQLLQNPLVSIAEQC